MHASPIFALMPLYTLQGIEISGGKSISLTWLQSKNY